MRSHGEASRAHPARALVRALGARARVALAVSALATLLERLALVGAAFELVREDAAATLALAVGLAVVFFVRSAARSMLRVEVQATLLDRVTSALLSGHTGRLGGVAEEAELSIVSGIYAAEALLGEQIPGLLGDLPACACVAVLAASTLPLRRVVEGAAMVTLGGLAVAASRGIAARAAERSWASFEPLLDALTTAARGGAEIAASGDAEAFLTGLRRGVRAWRQVAARASVTSFLAGRAPSLAVAGCASVVLLLDEGLRGALFHGAIGRAALLASMTPAFAGLARAAFEIGKSHARTEPVSRLLGRPAASRAAGVARPAAPCPVVLERVVFAYPGEAPVLSDLTATFRPGEIVALTGPNGSGKTTLLAVLLGVASPASGSIGVGEVALSAIDPGSWRRSVGYLAQRPFFPDRATARTSMRLLAPGASDEALREALARVGLWERLGERSPRDPLGALVATLSAGDRQRLALARVLSRGARVLLLDEPDANLDAAGLDLLVGLLGELAPGRIVVIAAHTPRLVAAAHHVLSLGGLTEARLSATSGG